ncbi:peptide chain release factor N(5)-glutamine methyltransferase [Capsulimonas corticalis]|uniref:peptide chain release factor N(5)-glutamine methyltransferase n=1 Tax=Capsulimonas corticalis TaxID=2219043 RepID=UPI00140318D8|nr:peptide chain release factor N(5)-glutamine methyltransferase [Capsulimonas corticalis]
MTVQEALTRATAMLAAAEVETPRLDARLMLEWTLKCRREDLAREPEREIGERERIIFEKAVALRALRRPLPYITGEQYFYGRPFKINRAVLIPRPETEMLVSLGLEKLSQAPQPRIADIGTGSGCIAVSLACERPEARVWATDLSGDALKLARKNVVRYDLTDRLTLLHGDLLAPLPRDTPFDLIVSNPPYIAEHEIPHLQPEVRDYEPALALSGAPGATGDDGAALYRRLLQDSLGYLRPNGWILLEVGQGQADTVIAWAESLGYLDAAAHDDMSGIPRVIQARRS